MCTGIRLRGGIDDSLSSRLPNRRKYACIDSCGQRNGGRVGSRLYSLNANNTPDLQDDLSLSFNVRKGAYWYCIRGSYHPLRNLPGYHAVKTFPVGMQVEDEILILSIVGD